MQVTVNIEIPIAQLLDVFRIRKDFGETIIAL